MDNSGLGRALVTSNKLKNYINKVNAEFRQFVCLILVKVEKISHSTKLLIKALLYKSGNIPNNNCCTGFLEINSSVIVYLSKSKTTLDLRQPPVIRFYKQNVSKICYNLPCVESNYWKSILNSSLRPLKS